MQRSLISFIVVLMATSALANLGCLDGSGNPVSWFTAIRYPGSLTATNPRYAYLDPNAGSSFQVIQGSNVDDQSQPLGKTVDNINALTGDSKNLLVLTNTPPNGTLIDTGAHAKAIIAFDNQTQTGVYILFSFLSYPDVAGDGTVNYTVPLDGNQYAQMNAAEGNYLYCLSFDADFLGVLVELLPNEQPNILYSSGLFSNMPVDPNFNYEIRAFTVPGADFQWFVTKSPNANLNMYDDILANAFGVNLAVASSGNQSNSCPPNVSTIVNVQNVKINSDDTWLSTDDNSKWAVAILETLESTYLCDNDRTPEQNNRGGSCFVTPNVNLYNAFLSIQISGTCPTGWMNWMDILQ